MDAMIHQVFHQSIDHTVALDRRLSRERLADDPNMKVTLAFTCVTGVFVTLIAHFEQLWCKGGLQPSADLINDGYQVISHGSTLRNGLTEVPL